MFAFKLLLHTCILLLTYAWFYLYHLFCFFQFYLLSIIYKHVKHFVFYVGFIDRLKEGRNLKKKQPKAFILVAQMRKALIPFNSV